MENFNKNEILKRNESKEELIFKYQKIRESCFFETSKGSKYFYDGDGGVLRYKTITKNWEPRNDLVVFFPPYEDLSISEKFVAAFKDKNQFKINLLNSVSEGNIMLTDSHGIKISSTSKLSSDEKYWAVIINPSSNKVEAMFPISLYPELNFSPYEQTYFHDELGKKKKRVHLGHSIIKNEVNRDKILEIKRIESLLKKGSVSRLELDEYFKNTKLNN